MSLIKRHSSAARVSLSLIMCHGEDLCVAAGRCGDRAVVTAVNNKNERKHGVAPGRSRWATKGGGSVQVGCVWVRPGHCLWTSLEVVHRLLRHSQWSTWPT